MYTRNEKDNVVVAVTYYSTLYLLQGTVIVVAKGRVPYYRSGTAAVALQRLFNLLNT